MKRCMGLTLGFFSLSLVGLVDVGPVQAAGPETADVGVTAAAVSRPMPARVYGQYGTNVDNRTNTARLAGGDSDMGGANPPCVFKTNANHPIEFDIMLPGTAFNRARLDPTQPGGNLRMDVFDIDSPAEVDEVRINGKVLGTLTGANNIWGVNQFPIPANTLRWGINRVQVLVDQQTAGSWCTAIGWGIITTPKSPTHPSICSVDIVKGWISPRDPVKGTYVNFFAEVAGNPPTVVVYQGSVSGAAFVTLTDPDGDGIYTGQKLIPANWTNGWKRGFTWKSVNTNAGKTCVSWFPAVRVR